MLTALWIGVNLPALDAQTTGSTNVPPTKDIYELHEIQTSLLGNRPLPIKLETYLSKTGNKKGEPEDPPKDEDIHWSASKGTPTFSPEKGGSVELDFGQPFVKEANPEARKVNVTASYSGSASVQPSSQSKDVERVYLDFWIAETEELTDDVVIVRTQDAQPTADEKKVIHWAKVAVKHSATGKLPLELVSSGDNLLYFYGEEQNPNQRSEDPPLESTLKKELENGQWFWIGTDAKGTGQAKFKAKGDAGKGLKDAPEEKTVNLLPVDIKVVKEGEAAALEDGLVVKKTDTVRYRLSPGLPDAPLLLEDKIQWHWRILKWDGTYSGWTAYENGQGYTFTAQPEDAGIYEVKATMDGQDFFLKRSKDDPHSAKKKDENECFGVVDEQWQINVRNQAKANLGSVAYAFAVANENVGKKEYKCNLFVGHKATNGGAIVPKINGRNPFSKYYPIANQWAGTQVANIPGWILLSVNTYPQPGYVVARGAPGGIGHTGIVDYDGAWIGAGTFNVNRKADLRNDISLRSGTSTYQPARFHKYTP